MSHGYSRRNFICATASGATAVLAGCLGDDGDEPILNPVSVDGQSCDVCGMMIGEHFGPNAQIFYRGGEPPKDRDGPVWFDSLREAIDYHWMQVSRGYEELVMYVVDYSTADYDVTEHDGTPLISSHTQPDVFVDILETVLVGGSAIEGAMGPDIIPFTDETEAEVVATEYDGDVVLPTELLDQ